MWEASIRQPQPFAVPHFSAAVGCARPRRAASCGTVSSHRICARDRQRFIHHPDSLSVLPACRNKLLHLVDSSRQFVPARPNQRAAQFAQPGPCRLVTAQPQHALHSQFTGPTRSTGTECHELPPPSRRHRNPFGRRNRITDTPASFFLRKSSLERCDHSKVILAESSGYPVSSTSQSSFKEYACIRWDVRSKY